MCDLLTEKKAIDAVWGKEKPTNYFSLFVSGLPVGRLKMPVKPAVSSIVSITSIFMMLF